MLRYSADAEEVTKREQQTFFLLLILLQFQRVKHLNYTDPWPNKNPCVFVAYVDIYVCCMLKYVDISVKDYVRNLACEYFPLILSVILKLELPT